MNFTTDRRLNRVDFQNGKPGLLEPKDSKDISKKEHRQMLIDTFMNSIFPYNDQAPLTFNCKDGAKTVTFNDMIDSISRENGSDLDYSRARRIRIIRHAKYPFSPPFLLKSRSSWNLSPTAPNGKAV